MRFVPATLVLAAAASGPAALVTYDQARPILEAMPKAAPPDLVRLDGPHRAAAWPAWVRARDGSVRQRLRRGEQDSVVNLLYFGTSFTAAPRLTADTLAGLDAKTIKATLARRIEDLVTALLKPGGDERVALARSAFGVAPPRPGSPARPSRTAIARAMTEAIVRVHDERVSFVGELSRISALPNPAQQFAELSTLFRERGIALDTSLRPAYAVDEALREAVARGWLAKGSVRRAAVIGPGLDYIDKAEGQDFYPPQSLQSFALADSLVRLGLSSPEALSISVFDISSRVLDHLERAQRRAQLGDPYVLQLPRPREGWRVGFVRYWGRFGDAVATPAEAARPPASAGNLLVRAVAVKPAVVASMQLRDLNVVYARPRLAPSDRFDLVVATNILVYYDTFEQSLALANVGSMMQAGGLFLANNAIPDLPFSKLHEVGRVSVVYSSRPQDGDDIVSYRRLPDTAP